MAYKLRAGVGNVVYDITDYTMEDGDVKLISSLEGKQLSISETDYIIIINNEKPNFLNEYTNDGNYVKINKPDYINRIKYLQDTSLNKTLAKHSDKKQFKK